MTNKLDKKSWLIAIFLLVLIVVIVIILFNSFLNRYSDYPIIYKNSDGKLLLLNDGDKLSDAHLLSNKDGTGYVLYGNTGRYILYRLGDDLYLFDNRKVKEVKVIEDVKYYLFSHDDKYVISINNNLDLYSFYSNKSFKIDSLVNSNITLGDGYVLYNKDNYLMLSRYDMKDKNIKLDKDVKNYSFSDDFKNVIYISNSNDLVIYNIKDGKKKTIYNDVIKYYCDSKSCNKMYFVSNNNIYFKDGNDINMLVEDINQIEAVDVDSEILLYSSLGEKIVKLFIKCGDNDSYLVDDSYGLNAYAKILNSKEIYYVNGDNVLKYGSIRNNKVNNIKELLKNVSGSFIDRDNGYYIFNNLSSGIGSLYDVRNGTIKKISDDVYSYSNLFVSLDGKDLYYYKNYDLNGSSLYVYNGKDSKLISDNVYSYQYYDDYIYYLKDYKVSKFKGDLYRYDDKNKLISKDIVSIANIDYKVYKNSK